MRSFDTHIWNFPLCHALFSFVNVIRFPFLCSLYLSLSPILCCFLCILPPSLECDFYKRYFNSLLLSGLAYQQLTNIYWLHKYGWEGFLHPSPQLLWFFPLVNQDCLSSICSNCSQQAIATVTWSMARTGFISFWGLLWPSSMIIFHLYVSSLPVLQKRFTTLDVGKER